MRTKAGWEWVKEQMGGGQLEGVNMDNFLKEFCCKGKGKMKESCKGIWGQERIF